MKYLKVLLPVLILLGFGCRQHMHQPTLVLISTHALLAGSGMDAAIEKYREWFIVKIYDPAGFNAAEVSGADLVLCESLGARISLLQPQLDSIRARTKILYIDTPGAQGNVDTVHSKALKKYWDNANTENFEGLFSYIGSRIFGLPVPLKQCIEYPPYGFYHTGQDSLFRDLSAYLDWYAHNAGHRYNPDSITIGLVYYQSAFVKKDLKVIDALIRNIESKGHNVLPLLAKGQFKIDSFFMQHNHPVADALIYGGMFLDFAHPEQGRLSAQQLDLPLLVGAVSSTETIQDWEHGQGGFLPRMTDRLFFTERDGAFEPLLIGAQAKDPKGNTWTAPIPYQVDWRVDRALSWARLRRKANHDKKIVITYYSEGGGKANVGGDIDAYLNVPASIVNLLKALRAKGYSTGTAPVPSTAELSKQMALHASNVGSWAGEELIQRSSNVHQTTIRIPVSRYLQWFRQYPKKLQDAVTDTWGPPPGNIMTITAAGGEKEFVIPVLQYGNILLAPHPNWGLQENQKVIYGSSAIPPHHSYIAFYEWMKQQYRADALLTLFTQLSLMPGKQEGPAADDFTGRLIGNLPHITTVPLMAGSGVKNKRRASALTIGYFNELTDAVLSDSLQQLKRMIDDRKTATNPVIRERQTQKIIAMARQQLPGKKREANDPEAYVSAIEHYIRGIIATKIPDGSHTLGEVPRGAKLQRLLNALTGAAPRNQKDSAYRKFLQTKNEYLRQLGRAGDEVSNILHALNGGYVPPGPSDDILRNPESLPSGRNPYGVNDKAIPSKEAWETGKRMADQLLIDFEQKHGKGQYPKKVAFVLWSTEITNSQGVQEAELLYLMGVQPVWNSKGQVMGAALIPAADLRRPRIDVLITTSGTYRDHFADKIALLDTAVRIAAAAPDSNNWIRIHSQTYQHTLKLKTPGTARIFSTALGAYSTNLEFAVEKADSWNNDTTLSDLYLKRMGNSYGNSDTAQQSALFTLNIKDVDAAAFSRSSHVLGIMDHPMVAAYYGAISLAVQNTTGRIPDLYINDLANKNEAQLQSLQDAYHKEMDTRYLNPAWIKSMQAQGYDGARYMEAFTENLELWNITKKDMVTDADWNQVYATYVDDRLHLQLDVFFEQHNPYAKQGLLSHLLEAAEKGYWHASEQQLQILATRLATTVARHGAACNTTVCNTTQTQNQVKRVLEKVPGGMVLAKKYTTAINRLNLGATNGKDISTPVTGYQIMQSNKKQQAAKDSIIYWLIAGLLMLIIVGFMAEIKKQNG
ncbi:cobaltochelatase subunit CobN [Niabella sp. CC-SYL272]|uniref:cobaltochelatase subunit CobN n=1 Tax=Niabella agricola TaxID=2891571 RepID=UPI001F3EBF86|nr:cobaltochelatase subunit CobN [Niabella agricola]MCF3108103.1 cobaltochelatase subunit CobN [Niabella agricola]